MTKQQVTKVASRQYGNLTKWQVDNMAIWQKGVAPFLEVMAQKLLFQKKVSWLFFSSKFEMWQTYRVFCQWFTPKKGEESRKFWNKKWESFLLFLVLFQFKMVLLLLLRVFCHKNFDNLNSFGNCCWKQFTSITSNRHLWKKITVLSCNRCLINTNSHFFENCCWKQNKQWNSKY